VGCVLTAGKQPEATIGSVTETSGVGSTYPADSGATIPVRVACGYVSEFTALGGLLSGRGDYR
jgi:hypothetical protein